MATRIMWDEYETALLIDTFWQIEGAPNRKQELIEGLSDALRKKALKSGVTIDEKFRNVNRQTNEGRKRTRKLFSTLNRRAKPVGQNENIALDEDDVCAIITRELLLEHPLFGGESVINSKGKQIPANNKSAFTSLITLYQCVQSFVFWRKAKEGMTSKSFKGYLYQRPEETEIDSLYQDIASFFDSFMKNTPAIMHYVTDTKTDKASDYRNSSGGNLLFRPVALTEYISAALVLCGEKERNYDRVFSQLNKIPLSIGQVPWLGFLWDGTRIINRVSRTLIQSVIVYLADEKCLDEKKYGKMVEGYAKARNISSDHAESILKQAKHDMIK